MKTNPRTRRRQALPLPCCSEPLDSRCIPKWWVTAGAGARSVPERNAAGRKRRHSSWCARLKYSCRSGRRPSPHRPELRDARMDSCPTTLRTIVIGNGGLRPAADILSEGAPDFAHPVDPSRGSLLLRNLRFGKRNRRFRECLAQRQAIAFFKDRVPYFVKNFPHDERPEPTRAEI